jgi:hypothetical protein
MDKNFYVPKKEWMTYCIGALGQGMIYAIMSSYISDFYLNVLKVTPIFVLLTSVTSNTIAPIKTIAKIRMIILTDFFICHTSQYFRSRARN